MTYVIGESCADVLDRACVGKSARWTVIYEGKRMLYIHPDECVDCGACEPVCPGREVDLLTRMTCRRSGRATPGKTSGSSPSHCLAATTRWLTRRRGQAGPGGRGYTLRRRAPPAAVTRGRPPRCTRSPSCGPGPMLISTSCFPGITCEDGHGGALFRRAPRPPARLAPGRGARHAARRGLARSACVRSPTGWGCIRTPPGSTSMRWWTRAWPCGLRRPESVLGLAAWATRRPGAAAWRRGAAPVPPRWPQMLTSLIACVLPRPAEAAADAVRQWGRYLTVQPAPYQRVWG